MPDIEVSSGAGIFSKIHYGGFAIANHCVNRYAGFRGLLWG